MVRSSQLLVCHLITGVAFEGSSLKFILYLRFRSLVMQFNTLLEIRIKKEKEIQWLDFVYELLCTNAEGDLVLKEEYSKFIAKCKRMNNLILLGYFFLILGVSSFFYFSFSSLFFYILLLILLVSTSPFSMFQFFGTNIVERGFGFEV